MYLVNKTAVITGSNSGIGLACLELFAKNGCDIIAFCRSENDDFTSLTSNLSKKYKIKITPVYLNLESKSMLKSGLKIIGENKQIDILINNAGYIYTGLIGMTSQKELEKIFQINYFTAVSFLQIVSKKMIKNRNGSIINISSTAALDGNIGRAGYASSKAALIALTKTAAHELGPRNIRVNCIAPGLTDTKMMRSSTNKNILPGIIDNTALKRVALPSEIASVALFLASDLSSYITAQTIRVDGGMHI